MPSPDIITFGCRLNSYESEVIRVQAQKAGLAQVLIFNTCAVTGEAERQAGQAIRKARRAHPDATLIVTGCAAQIHPEKFAEMPEVDFVIGNKEKLLAETYEEIAEHDYGVASDDEGEGPPIVRGYEGIYRAFVQVQNGCDNACTFCIIPQGRGPSRSVPFDQIAAQTRAFVAEGYNEIVITGVDIASYGRDVPGAPGLGGMLKKLLAEVPGINWLRLSSLDPAAFDDDLWDLIGHEPRLLPHLHLSLQAGDDMILKRMKRRHTRADIYALAQKARALRPDVTFGADIIAGFPTETEEMFENTLRLVEELDFTWLHVFPYSARSGTPAAKMPQVKGDMRKARAAKLREAGRWAIYCHLDRLIGQKMEILVEQEGVGRTPTFAEVVLPKGLKVGALVPVEITSRDDVKAVVRVLK